jgi:three-Cys-motif partner protein
MTARLDEVGYWTELKLEILKEYCAAYSKILTAQTNPKLSHVYVDAFAGPGFHISKAKGTFIKGSPLNALLVEPPFKEYHLIDSDGDKIEMLKAEIGDRSDVHLYQGDCNQVLHDKVLPRVKYSDYKRGLFLVDPYGLHLDWNVVDAIGKSKTVDMFLNFPIMDMNMNVLRKIPGDAELAQVERMNKFWGDESWKELAYSTQEDLFGESYIEKNNNEQIVQGYVERLKKVAGFKYVAKPMPMRNQTKSVVYYFIFASQKPVAAGIVDQVFEKYRTRGH